MAPLILIFISTFKANFPHKASAHECFDASKQLNWPVKHSDASPLLEMKPFPRLDFCQMCSSQIAKYICLNCEIYLYPTVRNICLKLQNVFVKH